MTNVFWYARDGKRIPPCLVRVAENRNISDVFRYVLHEYVCVSQVIWQNGISVQGRQDADIDYSHFVGSFRIRSFAATSASTRCWWSNIGNGDRLCTWIWRWRGAVQHSQEGFLLLWWHRLAFFPTYQQMPWASLYQLAMHLGDRATLRRVVHHWIGHPSMYTMWVPERYAGL